MEDDTRMQRVARISAALSGERGAKVSVFRGCDGVENTQTVIGLVAFDKAPTVDIDYLAGFPALTPQHIEATDILTECLADLGGIGLFLFAEMGDEAGETIGLRRDREEEDKEIPYFFAIGISADDAVYDGRLAGFCMEIIGTDGVNLDVLRVVDIDELFVDVRAVGSGVIEGGIEVAGLVSDL